LIIEANTSNTSNLYTAKCDSTMLNVATSAT
jgi:hypothetical protein